jgi:hypothetical protein
MLTPHCSLSLPSIGQAPPPHGDGELIVYLRHGHQQRGGKAMGLVLYDLAARFSVAVHDQVAKLVGKVEALAIVVTFDRV